MKKKNDIEMMKNGPTKRASQIGLTSLAVLVALSFSITGAQAQGAHQHPATNAPPDAKALSQAVLELRDKVARLEAEVQKHQAHPATPQAGGAMPGMTTGPSPNPAMSGMPAAGGMSGMDEMGMMKMMKGMMNMGNMASGSGSMPGMNMPAQGGMNMGMEMMKNMAGMMDMMKGMEMMGMGSMQSMNMPSGLPGFPGASHLYHIGATGFFLDHPQHITLTTEQQTALNKIKEQAALAKNTSDRQVEQAEQELWELTAADHPDAAKIETKIREIEKLRADQRLNFIRSVGDAAKALTDEQRKQLVGLATPAKAGTSVAPHATHTP